MDQYQVVSPKESLLRRADHAGAETVHAVTGAVKGAFAIALKTVVLVFGTGFVGGVIATTVFFTQVTNSSRYAQSAQAQLVQVQSSLAPRMPEQTSRPSYPRGSLAAEMAEKGYDVLPHEINVFRRSR